MQKDHRPTFWLLLFGGIYESGRGRLPSAALLFTVYSLLFTVFYLQFVVCCLQFSISYLQFCIEVYSHTLWIFKSLMAVLASPFASGLSKVPFVPSGFNDAAMKFCISMRVTSVFGVLYVFLFIMLYFYLGYLLDYFLAIHYVYTLLQSVEAVAYILAIQVIYLTVYCGFGLDAVNACGHTVDVDLSTST